MTVAKQAESGFDAIEKTNLQIERTPQFGGGRRTLPLQFFSFRIDLARKNLHCLASLGVPCSSFSSSFSRHDFSSKRAEFR
jgi:hypothetical protein